MKDYRVVNTETNKRVFTGTLAECEAFLLGMKLVDSSVGSLWDLCFIE